ncbi:MAG: hypothetical protein WCH46_02710 [bacterium]
MQLILPFFYPIVGDDAWVHLNWIEQFTRLFREGHYYPRMLSQGFWGFGSPAFYFYPPLTFWCAGILSFIIPTADTIYSTLQLIGTLLSFFTFYLYLRCFKLPSPAMVIGATIYALHPYRILDLYVRSVLSEQFSFIFIPLILLGIELAMKETSMEKRKIVKAIVISVIGWVGLLLTNVPIAIIIGYTAPFYFLLRTSRTTYKIGFVSTLFAGMIAVFMASTYLLPAIHYSASIKMAHLWDAQEFSGNIMDAITGVMGSEQRYLKTGLVLIYTFGLILLAVARTLKVGIKSQAIYRVIFLLTVVPLVVQLPFLDRILQNHLPFVNYVQFGYRWNVLLVCSTALLVALSFEGIENKVATYLGYSSLMIGSVICFGFLLSVYPHGWKYHRTTEHIDAPEYLPANSLPNVQEELRLLKLHASDPFIISDSGDTHISVISHAHDKTEFGSDGALRSAITFHLAYFESWKLINSRGEGIVLMSDSIGRMKTILPNKQDIYTLQVVSSSAETIGKILTTVGLSLFVICLVLTIFWRSPKVF